MATYLFRCWHLDCPNRASSTVYGETPVCENHGGMHRDYRAEGVGIGEGVRVSRTGTQRELAELFLPTNAEFAGPGDPDGKKGMRQWRETHEPKEGNTNPYWPGEVERTQF